MQDNTGYIHRRIRSFRYAFAGIWFAIKRGENFVIQLIIALIAISLGLILNISSFEWVIIILTIGAVLSAELLNTSIEKLADFVQPTPDPMIGTIKDIAAGGVLVIALAALVIGIVIFIPKLILLL